MAKVDQGVEVLVGDQPDAAAIAAVTAVGATERDELLAAETDAAIATVAGVDGDLGFVDEFHGELQVDGGRPRGGGAARNDDAPPWRSVVYCLAWRAATPAGRDRVAGRLLGADHAHGAALVGALHREIDLAVDQRVQRVVATDADAGTRMELGAALADDDVAGFDGLATEDLHTEVLRVGIAAVTGRANALFYLP
jgi:hypothetical protein